MQKCVFCAKIITLKDNYINYKVYLCINKFEIIMANATIQSVMQTDKAGLFTICFEGESYNEFQMFIIKGRDNATLQPDLQEILRIIQRMMQEVGFLERMFRPEGKMRDRVAALPLETNKLRLYCLRLSDSVLIVGNGGQKRTRTYNEDEELSGYVISLQKLDELLKTAERKGSIKIEVATIRGIDNQTFDI